MAEPLLFPDSEGESDVDSDGDNLMGRRQKHGHEPHSIPLLRLNKIADAIIAFYKEDDAFEHERGTQLYRLFQHLRGGPIKLQPEEESNRKFLRLLSEQPDGNPVQDDGRTPDEEAVQNFLQNETRKRIDELIERKYLDPGYAVMPIVDGARSSSPVAEDPQSENDSDTGDGFLQNQSLNLSHGQSSPPREHAYNEEEFFLSQNYESLLTPERERGDHNLPPLLISQRSHNANFIATPLGWSLLEIPSCS